MLRRLLIIPLSMLVVISVAFVLVELMPGDPATSVAGNFASEEVIASIRAELGLDQPFLQRYLSYVGDTARLDLGRSFRSNESVLSEIGRTLPATIELVVMSIGFAMILGIAVGVYGAYHARRKREVVARGFIISFQSVPEFILGLLLIYVVFFVAGLAPAPVGRLSIGSPKPESVTGFLLVDSVLTLNWSQLWDALRHSILPVATLGTVTASAFAKTAHSSVGLAMRSPQVEFARACGLSERTVVGYALVMARTTILTYGAILFGALISGAAILEQIFSWGGIGRWALQAILNLDVPAIQGFVIVFGLLTMLIYLLLDIAVVMLDPRVSYD
jgi:peptide/nickel transport system permease protein